MSDAAFAEYLLAKEPAETPDIPRADVYRRLVRAAFHTAIANSFPDTRAALGERPFDAMLAEFLDAGGPSTPFYRDIPGDLVSWAAHIDHPLADLMQWEWLELVAARHPADLDALEPSPLPFMIRPNPTMQLAAYGRPVEKITAEDPAPEQFESPMAYLVWRRPRTDQVETHRVGLLLARALALAADEPQSADALAERLAEDAPDVSKEAIAESLADLVRELVAREGIL